MQFTDVAAAGCLLVLSEWKSTSAATHCVQN
jgi:hypothetical protein